MNTSRKSLLHTGFLFLLLAILSVFSFAKGKPQPPPEPTPVTHEIVYEERTPSGAVNLVLVDASGTNKTILLQGDDSRSYLQPKFSPEGNQIVFVCSEGNINSFGTGDISGLCTINVDGTRFQRITARIGGAYSWPTYVTVNGELMILYSDDGDGDKRDLFMVPAEGGDPVNITHSPDIWDSIASMSADGAFIIAKGYDVYHEPYIYMYDFYADVDTDTMEATNPTIISTATAVCDFMQYLAMAKGVGDNRLAIVNRYNLYVLDLSGTEGPQQLTSEENIYSASFLPDGSGFVVSTTSDPPSRQINHIYTVDNDGSFLDLVTNSSKRTFLAYPDYREIF